ncbi:MAG: hypothetical protein FJ344_02790 [Sphingomonadales bacterium]|nr:hypothetical protein [Sphingomonadales bacterium]
MKFFRLFSVWYHPNYTGFFLAGLLVSSVFLGIGGCRPERFVANAGLELRCETDTVLFDTLLVQAGSITKRFKVYNDEGRNILIDEVYLAGRKLSGTSAYRININGSPVNALTEVELRARDSIYIFVEVTIDPNQQNTPFLVTDSVVLRSGNRTKAVQLVAYGQNAVFFNDSVLDCNLVWDNTLPIVVYNSVLVDSGCTLTIREGTRVYFNKNSSLFVLGTLRVEGTPANPVRMRGDRLDPLYRDLAGGWNGIHLLRGSIGHRIENLDLRNGTIGIRVDSLPADADSLNLIINKMRIHNCAVVGLLGYTARIDAYNMLISNCGLYNFLGDYGGTYRFRHCTFVHLNSGFQRGYPVFGLSNRDYNNSPSPTRLELENSLVWGGRSNELVLDSSGNGSINTYLSHCIIQSEIQRPGVQLGYSNPKFKNPSDNDFSIDTLSPAFQRGVDLRGLHGGRLMTDLIDRPRAQSPTLGALERIE